MSRKGLELAKNTDLQNRFGRSTTAYAVVHLDWMPVVEKFESLLTQYAIDKEANSLPN